MRLRQGVVAWRTCIWFSLLNPRGGANCWPRRAFSLPFAPAGVEERRGLNEAPRDYVSRLAREKAEAAWEGNSEVVLGADTTVVLGNRVMEKPRDSEEAREMLRALSGVRHTVMTGICLRSVNGSVVDCESTDVYFAPLSESEIDDYARSGEPMDKAGAYAIQGLASKFVHRIEGCYFNVMGLPLALFYRHWKSHTER